MVVWTAAAGVGPWDALIREKKSVVDLPLPIILGSDLAGIVDSVGKGVSEFKPGDRVLESQTSNSAGLMPNTRWRWRRW